MFALCIFSNYTVGGATVESGSVPACFFKQRQESYKNSDFGLVTVETSMPANNYAALTKIFNSSLKSSNLFETSTSEHKIFALYEFFCELHSISETHNICTLIPMNTRAQTLHLEASSKTCPTNPQD
jgi:hypothetical protein